MANKSDTLRNRIRQWLDPLRSTPLHPQWLVSRLEQRKTSWVAAKTTGHVLDVGCADRSIKSKLTKADSYTGLDYPTTASALYGTRPDVYGNASQLPFVESSFDSLLLLDVLEHVAEPESALREALRVLRPGGCILLTIPFAYPLHDQPHDYQRFTEHGLAYRLNQQGFTRVTIEEAGGGIEAATVGMVLALSQGSIEAFSAKSWRVTFALVALTLVPLINILGWLLSIILPATRIMPSAYFVQAYRR